jgi:hypothetical protein
MNCLCRVYLFAGKTAQLSRWPPRKRSFARVGSRVNDLVVNFFTSVLCVLCVCVCVLLGHVEDPRFFNRVATKSTVSQLTGVCILVLVLGRFRPNDLA